MTEGQFPPGCVLIFGKVPGIGGAVARCFANAGSDVALSFTEPPSPDAWRNIQELSPAATFHCMDAGIPGEAEAVIDQAIASHGGVHTVVWSANDLIGVDWGQDGSLTDWGACLATHTRGLSTLATSVLPHFRNAGGGSFVLLHGGGRSVGHGLFPALEAASDAVMQKLVGYEERHAVRSNSVIVDLMQLKEASPSNLSGTASPAVRGHPSAHGHEHSSEWPIDVGHAAVFLASRQAGRVTGQKIRVAA